MWDPNEAYAPPPEAFLDSHELYFEGDAEDESDETASPEPAAAEMAVMQVAPVVPEWLQAGVHISKVLEADGSIVLDGIIGPLVGADARVVEEGSSRVVCWASGELELFELATLAKLINDGVIERGDGTTPPSVEFVVRTEQHRPRLAGALLGVSASLFVPPQPVHRSFSQYLQVLQVSLFVPGHPDVRVPHDWTNSNRSFGSRYGTFLVGDIVKKSETGAQAAVARVLTVEWPPPPSPSKQWRNVLVLYEHLAEQPTFFIGSWSRWERQLTPAAAAAAAAAKRRRERRRSGGDGDGGDGVGGGGGDGGDGGDAGSDDDGPEYTTHEMDSKADVLKLTPPQLAQMEAALHLSPIGSKTANDDLSWLEKPENKSLKEIYD